MEFKAEQPGNRSAELHLRSAAAVRPASTPQRKPQIFCLQQLRNCQVFVFSTNRQNDYRPQNIISELLTWLQTRALNGGGYLSALVCTWIEADGRTDRLSGRSYQHGCLPAAIFSSVTVAETQNWIWSSLKGKKIHYTPCKHSGGL